VLCYRLVRVFLRLNSYSKYVLLLQSDLYTVRMTVTYRLTSPCRAPQYTNIDEDNNYYYNIAVCFFYITAPDYYWTPWIEIRLSSDTLVATYLPAMLPPMFNIMLLCESRSAITSLKYPFRLCTLIRLEFTGGIFFPRSFLRAPDRTDRLSSYSRVISCIEIIILSYQNDNTRTYRRVVAEICT